MAMDATVRFAHDYDEVGRLVRAMEPGDYNLIIVPDGASLVVRVPDGWNVGIITAIHVTTPEGVAIPWRELTDGQTITIED
jgi:hypothetical protein